MAKRELLPATLWHRAASESARFAEEAGLGDKAVAGMSALLALVAFFYFWFGNLWIGLAAATLSLFAERVAGEMRPGNAAPELLDRILKSFAFLLVPLWSLGWAHGLAAFGAPLEPVYATMVVAAIAIAHGVGRAIAAAFEARFGFALRDWSPLDRAFGNFAAGRTSDLAILFVSLVAGRPSSGIELVALWTILSATFDVLRLAQAEMRAWAGSPPKKHGDV